MTIVTNAQLLAKAMLALQAVTDTPLLDAEILLAHVLQKPRSHLHAWPDKKIEDEKVEAFWSLIQRRKAQEPIAYLIGQREFWSLPFTVTRETLIPRPETELIVETVLQWGRRDESLQIADLGTGSGAIALALAHERPNWQIVATDISQSALQIASNNAQRLGLRNISFYLGSWCTALPHRGFDVIVSNPPYIAKKEWPVYASGLAYEPYEALVSGEDGLDAIRAICEKLANYVKPNGYVALEHGFTQGAAVCELLALAKFSSISMLYDGAGLARVTTAKLVSMLKLDYN